MIDYSREIAGASLNIGAIKLRPEKPFKWASGFFMPIYNDNRMLLGNYGHRTLVAEGFKHIIEKEKIPYDFIAGTSTAGIAPATSVANLLGAPLAIIEDGKVHLFSQELIKELTHQFDGGKRTRDGKVYDVIASTCPFAIIPGVSLANEKKLPFIYVRQKKKEHGLQQQIEGILCQGQNVYMIDYYLDDFYFDNVKSAIEEKGGKFADGMIIKRATSFPSHIDGKKGIVIEDLVSTGGSSVGEVKAYREKGAEVTHCLSIFSYGLDKALKLFEEENCRLISQLEYPLLLEVAEEMNYIDKNKIMLLKEWRADPFKWGERHGFPPEVKK